MRKPIPISIHAPRSADLDLPPLARLDIAANSSHPLVALSFPYPFQALKLFLAHLRFCFERKGEYGILVARVRCGVANESDSSDADSGVDVSLEGEEDSGNEGAKGEIVGFIMWRNVPSFQKREGEEVEEWDWLSQLPRGANTSLWKRYTEVMSSDPGTNESDSVEILKVAVSPQHQRRGIGTKLLKACLDEVGERDVRVRASKDAKALYERYGWRCEKEFKLDLREWGRCRTYANFDMVRSADA
ncbi:hypothetical protein ONS95_002702 [Cadophora gregata]|uniref:uncharacterized protein n=1 Tax=Cadophora gregata TaxID=51156 RepID=UPI0026DAA364|nr:uncharacterized protein ONS95_002702 [Cadophora gregata]KAK0110042.1 hypothetical protein ONS95_002702 [Cadophora gregata]KAK0110337.1 hypothetical protein ONS96_001953 [Cadophora gregata f. sp. sojae]